MTVKVRFGAGHARNTPSWCVFRATMSQETSGQIATYGSHWRECGFLVTDRRDLVDSLPTEQRPVLRDASGYERHPHLARSAWARLSFWPHGSASIMSMTSSRWYP